MFSLTTGLLRLATRIGGGGAADVDPHFTAACEKVRAESGPLAMFDFMFEAMCESKYIQRERLGLNVLFPPSKTSPFLEVTINCSKPELVAGAIHVPATFAPGATTHISAENVGFKPGLRAWGFQLRGEDYFVSCSAEDYASVEIFWGTTGSFASVH